MSAPHPHNPTPADVLKLGLFDGTTAHSGTPSMFDKKRDSGYWRTINGAHVHLNGKGIIDKGPAHLVAKTHHEAMLTPHPHAETADAKAGREGAQKAAGVDEGSHVKKGDVVKLTKPTSEGEKSARYDLIEHNGNRVRIQLKHSGMNIPPVETVHPSEVAREENAAPKDSSDIYGHAPKGIAQSDYEDAVFKRAGDLQKHWSGATGALKPEEAIARAKGEIHREHAAKQSRLDAPSAMTKGVFGQSVVDAGTGKQGSMFDTTKPAPVSEPIKGSKAALDPKHTAPLPFDTAKATAPEAKPGRIASGTMGAYSDEMKGRMAAATAAGHKPVETAKVGDTLVDHATGKRHVVTAMDGGKPKVMPEGQISYHDGSHLIATHVTVDANAKPVDVAGAQREAAKKFLADSSAVDVSKMHQTAQNAVPQMFEGKFKAEIAAEHAKRQPKAAPTPAQDPTAKSKGHVGFITDADGSKHELYKTASGNLQRAPVSATIDAATGHRIGRFEASRGTADARAAQLMGAKEEAKAPAAATKRPETYLNGDRAEYTGTSHHVEMMEGKDKGKVKVTQRGPDGVNPAEDAKIAENRKNQQDMNEGMKRLQNDPEWQKLQGIKAKPTPAEAGKAAAESLIDKSPPPTGKAPPSSIPSKQSMGALGGDLERIRNLRAQGMTFKEAKAKAASDPHAGVKAPASETPTPKKAEAKPFTAKPLKESDVKEHYDLVSKHIGIEDHPAKQPHEMTKAEIGARLDKILGTTGEKSDFLKVNEAERMAKMSADSRIHVHHIEDGKMGVFDKPTGRLTDEDMVSQHATEDEAYKAASDRIRAYVKPHTDRRMALYGELESLKNAEGIHHQVVADALASGKSVPAHVLKEYPDLAAKAAKGQSKNLSRAA